MFTFLKINYYKMLKRLADNNFNFINKQRTKERKQKQIVSPITL
jgi:hypothetical protein